MSEEGREPMAAPHAPDHVELLRLARATLAHYLSTGNLLPYETDNDWYLTPAAVFVTLRVREARRSAGMHGESWAAGDLRGCIGHVDAERPLVYAVQDATIKAATADPRFYPVAADELDNLIIEVSVLSPLRMVTGLDEIEIGRDGLLIMGNRRRGLLLPEVPVMYDWGKEAFIRALCQKAGLPEDAWPDGALLFAFRTESFEEA
jgi:AmmeMemoRadiSam system protein A